jgi:hypothetical protein
MIRRDAKRHPFKPLLEDKNKKIANADVTTLKQLLLNGELTSVDLVTYFGLRCYDIGRKKNLHTEEYFEEAL